MSDYKFGQEHTISNAFKLSAVLIEIQGVLDLHEFWARNKFVQAKLVLVKLCNSMFSKIRACEILSTCYPRNGVYLKIRASEIRTSEICASQGPPVILSRVNPEIALSETVFQGSLAL